MSNYKSKNQKKRLVKNNKGRTVGWIIGDRFVKYASSSKHMLQNPRGMGNS